MLSHCAIVHRILVTFCMYPGMLRFESFLISLGNFSCLYDHTWSTKVSGNETTHGLHCWVCWCVVYASVASGHSNGPMIPSLGLTVNCAISSDA